MFKYSRNNNTKVSHQIPFPENFNYIEDELINKHVSEYLLNFAKSDIPFIDEFRKKPEYRENLSAISATNNASG